MRVIAGTFRSRLLVSPPGRGTRPTGDRLRETLFNILGPRIAGCRFADLFAGTGAVGIEAMSRGAAHTFFAENGLPALKALKFNLGSLGVKGNYTLEDRGSSALLQCLSKSPERLDIVFLDPPYASEDDYTQTLEYLGSPAHASLLSPEALVLAEHATQGFNPRERYGSLSRTRLYKQGETSVSFFQPDPMR